MTARTIFSPGFSVARRADRAERVVAAAAPRKARRPRVGIRDLLLRGRRWKTYLPFYSSAEVPAKESSTAQRWKKNEPVADATGSLSNKRDGSERRLAIEGGADEADRMAGVHARAAVDLGRGGRLERAAQIDLERQLVLAAAAQHLRRGLAAVGADRPEQQAVAQAVERQGRAHLILAGAAHGGQEERPLHLALVTDVDLVVAGAAVGLHRQLRQRA